jgi:hypothetical protein
MAKTYKNGKTKTRRQRKNNKTNRRRYIRGGKDCSQITNSIAKRMCETTNAKEAAKTLQNTKNELIKRGEIISKLADNTENFTDKAKQNLELIIKQKEELDAKNKSLDIFSSIFSKKKTKDFNKTI